MIDRLAANQVINRQATWNTSIGAIDLITMGAIPNAISTTTLPTGQVRPTGQDQAVEVPGEVMFADDVSVAQINLLKDLSRAGAPTAIQRGSTFQYFNEDGSEGPTVIAEEAFVVANEHPSTDVSAAGEGARFGFTISVFNARKMVGT